jgi:hypothetical protein
MANIKIGKANYSDKSDSKEKTVFYSLGHKVPADRRLTLRFAPPIGELADKGIWKVFIKDHWGYTLAVVDGQGKKRNIPLKFGCIEKTDRNGNVLQECPECEEIKRQKLARDTKEKALKEAGKDPETIETSLKFVKDWIKAHNLDRKWHMVAKDLSGKWGFAKMSHSCEKLLLGEIQKQIEKGQDPIGLKGMWFDFERTGNSFNDIKDLPKPTMEEDSSGAFRFKFDTLTDSDFEQLEKLMPLNQLSRMLSYEQIEQLVQSGGDEQVVRAVFGMPVREESSSTVSTETTTKAGTSSPEVNVEEESEDNDEEAALLAKLAAVKAAKNKTTAPKASPALAAKVSSIDPDDLESFLAEHAD